MKRIVIILSAAVLMLSLAACGTKPVDVPATIIPVENTDAATETAALPEESTQPEESAQPEPEQTMEIPESPDDSSSTRELTEILEGIDANVMPGTAGNSLRSAGQAAVLLDWAAQTDMSTEDARSATVDWLSPKGNDLQVAFNEKISCVDEAYKQLISADNAQDILSSAGCQDSGYPWNEAAFAIVEAIMTAIGLR